MSKGIYLSEGVLIAIVTIMIAFVGWLRSSYSNINKKIDENSKRLNKVEINNARRDIQIDYLSSEKYRPFTEKEKKKDAG